MLKNIELKVTFSLGNFNPRHVVKIILWACVLSLTIVATCFGGMLVIVGTSTADSADSAEKWLLMVNSNQIDEAYETTSSIYQAKIPKNEFSELANHISKTKFELMPWFSRNLEFGIQTRYYVELTDNNNHKLPLALRMGFEDQQWKVWSIIAPQWQVPSETFVQNLVMATMEEISEAIATRDFYKLHKGSSARIFLQTSPTTLQVAFQDFIDNEISIPLSKLSEAKFYETPNIRKIASGPAVHEILVAEGYFSLSMQPWDPITSAKREMHLPFSFKYTYEIDAWKLWQFYVGLPINTNEGRNNSLDN